MAGEAPRPGLGRGSTNRGPFRIATSDERWLYGLGLTALTLKTRWSDLADRFSWNCRCAFRQAHRIVPAQEGMVFAVALPSVGSVQ